MENKYYELHVSVYLKKNIKKEFSQNQIAKFINYSFEKSQYLSDLHKSKNRYKGYCFSGLYPIEKDKIYKANEIYSFIERTLNEKFILEEMKCMEGLENDDFIVTEISQKTWNYSKINHIDNLTSTIITFKNKKRFNKGVDTLESAQRVIFNNLLNKYNFINKTNFSFNYNDIIENITIKNDIGINTFYKGINFLGYKFKVQFKNNPIAQQIANLAVAQGIGEKNSCFGAGFVKPYFER